MDYVWANELVTVFEEDGCVIMTFNTSKVFDEALIQRIGKILLDVLDTHPQDLKFVLDYTGVTFQSSAMIGKLILFSQRLRARRDKSKWAICGLIRETREVFEITRLNKVFDIHETRERAVAAVNSSLVGVGLVKWHE